MMELRVHGNGNRIIAEIISDNVMINNVSDGLNLLGDMYYQGFSSIILYNKNITPEFFNLENGIAGEILQKFSNYRMRLAIIGNFSDVTSKSLLAFVLESNKSRQINFVSSLSEAVKILTTL